MSLPILTLGGFTTNSRTMEHGLYSPNLPYLVHKACKMWVLGNQSPSWRNLHAFPVPLSCQCENTIFREVIFIKRKTMEKGHLELGQMRNLKCMEAILCVCLFTCVYMYVL